jgi:hypothetical protein
MEKQYETELLEIAKELLGRDDIRPKFREEMTAILSAQTELSPAEKTSHQHASARNTVFISYSSKDRGFVLQLADHLGKCGYEVWLDINRVTGRKPYWNEIQEGVENSSYFVFVISPDSIAEDSGALTELYHAAGLKPTPRIIPILARMVEFKGLPILISPGRYQIHDFTKYEFDEVLSKVLAALR